MTDRGSLTDRPWGATLGAVITPGRTGQLTVRTSTGGVHAIAFSRGMVIGASSPLAADSIGRIAQAERLVTAKRVAELARGRRTGARDEVESFVAAASLEPADARRLKRRILLQRSTRTFALEAGDYAVDDRVTIPIVLGTEVDVGSVVYHGARLQLHSDRLIADLGQLGSRFSLVPDVTGLTARFELGEPEQLVVDALRSGTSLPELEAAHRELDPRMMQAVIYALVTCGVAVRADPGRPPRPAPPPSGGEIDLDLDYPTSSARLARASESPATHVATPREPTLSCVPMIIRADPTVTQVGSAEAGSARTKPKRLPTGSYAAPLRDPATMRAMTDPFLEARNTTLRPNALSADEVRALILDRQRLVEAGADYFTLLALPVGAPVEAVRAAYVELARHLKPERLVELGLRDPGFHARSLFAQVCIAYTVLTDPARRASYIAGLWRSGVALDP